MIGSSRPAAWMYLGALGTFGAASLLLLPVAAVAPIDGLPVIAIRLKAALTACVIIAVATAIGCALAPRAGFGAPVLWALASRRPWWPSLIRSLPSVIIVAVTLISAAVVLSLLTSPFIADAGAALRPVASLGSPLVTRVFYGGIAQELMLRWGLVSLIVSAVRWLYGAEATSPPMVWGGISVVAALFAVACFPLLQVATASIPGLVFAVACCALSGMLLGWLFWRHGLEAAMLAHVAAQMFAFLLGH